MRRSGYFATVAGARPSGTDALDSPRRVFAFERGFVSAPTPASLPADPVDASAPSEDATAQKPETAPGRREVVDATASQSDRPSLGAAPRSGPPGARLAGSAERARGTKSTLSPAPLESSVARGSVRKRETNRAVRSLAAGVGAKQPLRQPLANETPVALSNEARVPEARRARRAAEPTAREARVPEAHRAMRTAQPTSRDAPAPQLHIGAIDVTVVQAPASTSPPRRHRPPVGPARPAPWFGLAQR